MLSEEAKAYKKIIETGEVNVFRRGDIVRLLRDIEAQAKEIERLQTPCKGCAQEVKNYANLNTAKALVERQALDEGLWFIDPTAPEAYLQRALRHIHAVIEGHDDNSDEGESSAIN